MDNQVTLDQIFAEVKKVNERLRAIESIIEEIITRDLPQIQLEPEEINRIKKSVEEMKKGEYVTLIESYK